MHIMHPMPSSGGIKYSYLPGTFVLYIYIQETESKYIFLSDFIKFQNEAKFYIVHWGMCMRFQVSNFNCTLKSDNRQ